MKNPLFIISLVLLLAVAVGCQNKAEKAELEKFRAQGELEARNTELIKTFNAELDKGNIEIFLKLLAPDYKYIFPSNNSAPMSREDGMAMAKMMMMAIPDMTHNITEIFAIKDRVVMRYVVQGTHKAEIEGIPPTGNKIAVSAISIYRIKDGLIVEEVEDADILGFYQQLGMQLKPKEAEKK